MEARSCNSASRRFTPCSPAGLRMAHNFYFGRSSPASLPACMSLQPLEEHREN